MNRPGESRVSGHAGAVHAAEINEEGLNSWPRCPAPHVLTSDPPCLQECCSGTGTSGAELAVWRGRSRGWYDVVNRPGVVEALVARRTGAADNPVQADGNRS